jgi:hypothetical protein
VIRRGENSTPGEGMQSGHPDRDLLDDGCGRGFRRRAIGPREPVRSDLEAPYVTTQVGRVEEQVEN